MSASDDGLGSQTNDSVENAQPRIRIPQHELSEFCRRNHITHLALFGSVLSDDFGPDSDVDVLVDFEPGHVPGLRFIDLQDELSRLFDGRPVDLVTRKSLGPRLRPHVLRTAQIQYERA